MVASQMIYTACGKDKTGAFSVWSKSSDVTKQECDEIIKLMSYKKSSNLPYEPTEEEIKKLFPQKIGYFKLSSGRYCLAKTTYVGKVYSDVDSRNGNFIIHSYLFNKDNYANIISLLESNNFKTMLSYKEWHDNPIPDELPIINLVTNKSDIEFITQIISSKYKNEYFCLLQAIINASMSNNTVTFNIDENNELNVYKLIYNLLPVNIASKLTFMNQYSTQLDYLLEFNSDSKIIIRNIFNDMVGKAYNYKEQIANNQYAFNFITNDFCSVSIGKYIQCIINSFNNNENLNIVLDKVNSINNIINLINCDINTATDIYHLIKKQFLWFNNSKDLYNAINIVINNNSFPINDIIDGLQEQIFEKNIIKEDDCLIELKKLVYKYLNPKGKEYLIKLFIKNLEQKNDFYQPDEFYNYINKNIYFEWNDFINLISSDITYLDKLVSLKNNLLLTFVFLGLLDVKDHLFDNNKVKILNITLNSKKINFFTYMFNNLFSTDFSFNKNIFDMLLLSFKDSNLSFEYQFDTLICNICNLNNKENIYDLLYALMVNYMNIDSNKAIFLYMNNRNKYISLLIEFERIYSNKSDFKKLFNAIKIFMFEQNQCINYSDIESYINLCKIEGFNIKILPKKLKEYFFNIKNDKKLVLELYKIFNLIFTHSQLDGYFDSLEVIKNIIITIPHEKLIKYKNDEVKYIKEITNKLIENSSSNNEDIIEFSEYMNLIFFSEYKSELYKGLSNIQLQKFVNKYSDIIVEKYLFYIEEYDINEVNLLMLYPILKNKESSNSIAYSISQSKSNMYIITKLLLFIKTSKQEVILYEELVKNIFINYINLNKKNMKIILKYMKKEDLTLRESTTKYLDQICVQKKSLYKIFFSKKKKG